MARLSPECGSGTTRLYFCCCRAILVLRPFACLDIVACAEIVANKFKWATNIFNYAEICECITVKFSPIICHYQ